MMIALFGKPENLLVVLGERILSFESQLYENEMSLLAL